MAGLAGVYAELEPECEVWVRTGGWQMWPSHAWETATICVIVRCCPSGVQGCTECGADDSGDTSERRHVSRHVSRHITGSHFEIVWKLV